MCMTFNILSGQWISAEVLVWWAIPCSQLRRVSTWCKFAKINGNKNMYGEHNLLLGNILFQRSNYILLFAVSDQSSDLLPITYINCTTNNCLYLLQDNTEIKFNQTHQWIYVIIATYEVIKNNIRSYATPPTPLVEPYLNSNSNFLAPLWGTFSY